MAIFGYNTGDCPGAHTLNDYVKGLGDITPASSGTGDKISVKLAGWDVGEKVKCCLYWNDAGTYRKVTNGETEERTTGGTTGNWFDFNFSTGPTISSSVAYLLCAWSDSNVNAYRKTSGGAHTYYYKSTAYGAWANPITWGGSSGSYEIDIYCTYTEGGAALTHTCSDTMTISDSTATVSVMKHAKADTMAISDAGGVAASLAMKHTAADTVAISDAGGVATVSVMKHAAADTMTIGDVIETVSAMKHTAADTMGISDVGGVIASLQMKLALADQMDISDSVVAVLSEAEIAAIRRLRMIYGLKPARVPKIGHIGV